MKKITLNSIQNNNVTPVSNLFLDGFMNDANGEFVKVYLYLLRCINGSCTDISISQIGDTLNLTEKDVIRALKYWAKVKVLSVDFEPNSNEPSSITFLALEPDKPTKLPAASEVVSTPTVQSVPSIEPNKTPEPINSGSGNKHLSPSQINRIKEREDMKQLLYLVEKYTGKTLSSVEIGIVLFMHEKLEFSTELIEYLVEYCVTNHKTSLRYMEKVALSWHENGISTIKDARNSNAIRSSRTLAVSKSFGLTDRNITPVEMDFINRWYDEYGFDKEIIIEACKRTIMSMNKPNFSYADGILKKWKVAKIHTLSDLKTFDAGFRAKINVPVTTNSTTTKSTNKFNNFSQRSYDFEQMEKDLISNNK